MDKVPNCAVYKKDGLCDKSHVDHHIWRTRCVKACGQCEDPVYTAPCLPGFCGPSHAKEEDQYHLLTITSVKCIKPSSGLDDAAKYGMSAVVAVGVGAAVASGCIATAGGCAAALPAMMGTLGAKAAAVAVAAKNGASAASSAKAGLEFLDQRFSGTDDLIVKINGMTVLPAPKWPCRRYNNDRTACLIDAGQTITGKTSFSFKNTATIQLLEYDTHSDNDDLGWLRVDPSITQGGEQIVILSEPEGTIYSVSFTVKLGGGNKDEIPEYLQCGTVECRPCAQSHCRGSDGLDRDGDKEDLKKCPSGYVLDRYEKFPQWWPASDVYLKICKLD